MSANCPSCHIKALALWKKAFLSPLAAIPCEACDVELKVTWRSYLMAISIGSLIFLLAYVIYETDSLLQYVGFGLGFALMLLGQVFFMPLESVVSKSDGDSAQ